MSEELDKHLAEAMGAAPADEKSTSKATLRTPPIVADKPAKVMAEAPKESAQEAYLRGKLDALTELLSEERKAKRHVKDITAAHKDVEADLTESDVELVEFTVSLPVQAQWIRVDGREYYHGYTYKLPRIQALSFLDIQAQAWRHDEQVRGYRPHAGGVKTNGVHINAQGQQMSAPVF